MSAVDGSMVCLQQAVRRLDEILVPWGFRFRAGEDGAASAGGYANGCYVRGSTRIELIWRIHHGLGCVAYVHEEIQQQGYLRERMTWEIGHPGFMRAVGHPEDCHLVESGITSLARGGGDVVEALAFDLRNYAAGALSRESPEFLAIVKSGFRRREVL